MSIFKIIFRQNLSDGEQWWQAYESEGSVKKVGLTATAISAVAGGAAAASPYKDQLSLPGASRNQSSGPSVDLRTNRLSKAEASTLYERAQSANSVARLQDFIAKKATLQVNRHAVSGRRITGEDIAEHTLLEIPLHPRRGGNYLQVRMFEGGISAQAYMDGNAYFSPAPGGPSSESSARTTPVVPLSEWSKTPPSDGQVQIQSSWDQSCLASGTFDAGGPVCTFLSGIAAIGSGILIIIPEPGTTASGVVALSLVLAGGCLVAEALEDGLNLDCEVTEIGVCVSYPTLWSPTGIYAYPAGCV